MTSIIEIAVPAEQLALSDTLDAVPETRVDVMRTVTTGPNSVMPVLAFEGNDEDIGPALREDKTVERVSPLATLEKESVYRVQWASHIEDRLREMFWDHGTVLRTQAFDGKWCFRVLFAERESMEDWYHHCRDCGLTVDIESIYDPTVAVRPRQYGLSQKQYTTLETALQHGFYDIPRKVTLEELADEFDVTHQALSERLSRAHRVMITNVVSADFPLAHVK
jgi:predicted DNA binding protein